jgi:hypothetical protein
MAARVLRIELQFGQCSIGDGQTFTRPQLGREGAVLLSCGGQCPETRPD